MSNFTDRYPLPWSFDQTDPDGAGVLRDANGQLLVILMTHRDWEEHGEDSDVPDPRYQPVMNDDDEGPELIDFILDRINLAGKG